MPGYESEISPPDYIKDVTFYWYVDGGTSINSMVLNKYRHNGLLVEFYRYKPAIKKTYDAEEIDQ